MIPNKSWDVPNLQVWCQQRCIPSPHIVSFLSLINIISCFSLWLSSTFSDKTQACVLYFCSTVVFRTSHLWLLGGFLSCEHNDYPCLMEAKWLKADSLAKLLKPGSPRECRTETNRVERVTRNTPPPKSKARWERARQLFKQHEQEGVGMLRFFLVKT